MFSNHFFTSVGLLLTFLSNCSYSQHSQGQAELPLTVVEDIAVDVRVSGTVTRNFNDDTYTPAGRFGSSAQNIFRVPNNEGNTVLERRAVFKYRTRTPSEGRIFDNSLLKLTYTGTNIVNNLATVFVTSETGQVIPEDYFASGVTEVGGAGVRSLFTESVNEGGVMFQPTEIGGGIGGVTVRLHEGSINDGGEIINRVTDIFEYAVKEAGGPDGFFEFYDGCGEPVEPGTGGHAFGTDSWWTKRFRNTGGFDSPEVLGSIVLQNKIRFAWINHATVPESWNAQLVHNLQWDGNTPLVVEDNGVYFHTVNGMRGDEVESVITNTFYDYPERYEGKDSTHLVKICGEDICATRPESLGFEHDEWKYYEGLEKYENTRDFFDSPYQPPGSFDRTKNERIEFRTSLVAFSVDSPEEYWELGVDYNWCSNVEGYPAREYEIQNGDTLSQIALDNDISVDQILINNPKITDRNVILAGATLKLPSRMFDAEKGIFVTSGATSALGNTNSVFVTSGSNFKLLVVGDCNLDGVVDFSDIPAFISILIAGDYLVEADIDQDGDVDFFDIPAFIELLQAS